MTEVIDITDEGQDLLIRAESSAAGRASKSLLHGDHQRAVLIALTAGSEMAEHEAPTAATLHVITGTATLMAGDEEWVIGPGQLAVIPSERHAVGAQTDCIMLLTVTL